ncbi:MAG: hypothetical protein WBA87_00030, partial [Microbacterium sp.]
ETNKWNTAVSEGRSTGAPTTTEPLRNPPTHYRSRTSVDRGLVEARPGLPTAAEIELPARFRRVWAFDAGVDPGLRHLL